jgi:hypothetical protein
MADSKSVKQEVNGTGILPPLVFPGGRHHSLTQGTEQDQTCIPQNLPPLNAAYESSWKIQIINKISYRKT